MSMTPRFCCVDPGFARRSAKQGKGFPGGRLRAAGNGNAHASKHGSDLPCANPIGAPETAVARHRGFVSIAPRRRFFAMGCRLCRTLAGML